MTDPGRLFMFGAYGMKPSRETVSLFKTTNASGLLLLARNIDTPAQTAAFVDELEQRIGRPLLVAVDHEGGWVLRFKSGLTAFPGNAALGRTREAKLAYAVGRQMARELAALGIRMNLAPVLDVATAKYNPGVGIRSFGDDPRLVGKLGIAFAQGLQDHGVSACAKHFPGKGAACVDAHVDLPTIKISRSAFARVHLAPFREAARARVDAVMTSHARFPAFDSVPATFSTKIVRGILRKTFHYDGLIVSDDLCMGAITKRWPVVEATLKCLNAGHDMLMIAHDLQGMRDAAEMLREAGTAEADVCAASTRIARLLPRRTADRAPNLDQGLSLARSIAKRAVRVARRGSVRLPVVCARETMILIPDFQEVRDRFTFENGPRGPEELVRRLCQGTTVVRTPLERAHPRRIEAAIRRAKCVVFACFEARRFPAQAAILELLSRTAAKKTVAVLIRSSWDLELCPATMTVIDAAGYRLVSLEAAFSLIFGGQK